MVLLSGRVEPARREIETQLELTQEGILTTTLSQGAVLSRVLQNGFGETIRQEQPHAKGGFTTTFHFYNDRGQLIRTQKEAHGARNHRL